MRYSPPIMVSSDTEETYQTQVYLDTKYDLKNIKKCIEHGFLSKTSIPRGPYTLNIYDIGEDGFNLFILGPKEIEEYLGFDKYETIVFIDTFLNNPSYALKES